MARRTLILTLWLVGATAASAEDSVEVQETRRLAVLSYLAEKCHIEISPTMSKWVAQMLSDVSESDRQEYNKVAELVHEDQRLESGRVGSCYKLRVDLYRDGWLQ